MAKSKIQFQKVTTHITDNIYDLLRRAIVKCGVWSRSGGIPV